ncbi:MAG: DUF4080 domain-containing protein [Candidatus Izemoplasmatales bacterium]
MVLLIALDAKYIHTNLAVRLLKANCDFPVTIKEFTINDRTQQIMESIVSLRPEVIGFSVYIWNVMIVKKLTKAIKDIMKTIIVWGGPEVSYDYEEYIRENPVDYIISGEGEITFNKLLRFLKEGGDINRIPNLIYREKGKTIATKKELIADLSSLKDPYRLEEFIDDIPHKIQYLELSRGCPFHCSYCLASLDNKIRYFPVSRVIDSIDYLLSVGARTFKFLDRTFNVKETLAEKIIDHIIDLDIKDVSFQFEITGDILSQDFIDKINSRAPRNRIRFEIGIQSTNPETNALVNRHQDIPRLFQTIKYIQEKDVIDLHLDLIAGLPQEDIVSFETTFNKSIRLFPKELQLGVLKLLRGTSLRDEAKRHGYVYNADPPYEIYSSKWLSAIDMQKIVLVERMLNVHYNKGFMNRAIRFVIDNVASPFSLFLALGNYWKESGYAFGGYQLMDVFERFNMFIEHAYPEISGENLSLLKLDYLLYHKQKPKLWWRRLPNRNEILRKFYETNREYQLVELYKRAVVTTYRDHYLIVVYGESLPVVFHHS